MGTAYLQHLDPGLPTSGAQVARHCTDLPVQDRVGQRLAGRGSPLIAAVIAAGGTATLQRTWNDTSRQFERALRRRHEAPRLRPHGANIGHTGGRGLLLNPTRHLRPSRPGPTLSR